MEYRGVIFTKHALERLNTRSVTHDMIVQTVEHPDRTQPTGTSNSTKFIKYINQRNVQVVANFLPDQHKWLVISVWVRGEDDQLPLVWRIMTLPFVVIWSVIKLSWNWYRKKQSIK